MSNQCQYIRRTAAVLMILGLITSLLPGFAVAQDLSTQETPGASPAAERPSVGAIRWDAWTGGSVTDQVERTLAPEQFRSRLPWFAEVRPDGTVRIDGRHQSVMDQEIAYAGEAGLDYWAFLLYPDADTMSVSLQHYLSSKDRQRLDFCLILHNSFKVPDDVWPHERDRALALLRESGYHSVAGGRPLVFLFSVDLDEPKLAGRVADFRQLASEQGPEPYMVYMGWNPAADRARTAPLGFDAVSGYAVASNDPTFARLVQRAEGTWHRAATAGVPYVPLVTTGWDKEPRKLNPVSWELDHNYHNQDVFPSVATPDEIATHLVRAIDFVRANPTICQAGTVIAYAWNEHDEGGWLCPTWTAQGPDTSRLDAINLIHAKEPVDYVDPKIGTAIKSKRWMLFPGATTPFGMVALSPDNLDRTGWYKGGFDPHLDNMMGFSHIHAWSMAGLLTMPTVGELKVKPGSMEDPDSGYRSRFSNDVASPGYYAVTLDDYKIRAELTATTRTGFHRYTFPKTDQARVLFDLKFPSEYNYDLIYADIKKVSDTEIIGYSRMVEKIFTGPWQDYILHFVIQFDKPFKSHGFWRNNEILTNTDQVWTILDADTGAFVDYSTEEGEAVMVKTGFSLVSIEQARLNLEMETAGFGWDFDAAKNAARKTWNDLLKKVEIEGGTKADKTKFFTAFYRSYCARATLSDVNGKYRDMCEQVVQLKDPDSPVYGCDAFWNTFWNLNLVWSLVTPDIANKWVNSLLETYDRGGWLPKGPAGMEYSGVMVAEHEIALIVGAYQMGIRNYDVEKAYQAMRKMVMEQGIQHGCGGFVGNENMKVYMELGYVPYEEGPVSNTLEYAYDDWCVAQMAKALGKTDDYGYFLKRSQNYRSVFDSSTGFTRPKSRSGEWLKDFAPMSNGPRRTNVFESSLCNPFTDFVEGNAWQFTFFVPHDVPGLIELIGKDKFNSRLKDGFERSRDAKFSSFEYVDYINHGNQPNMQAAYLFNWSGMPWEAQYWAREIMDAFYGTTPEDGYQGDEDEGQMSAWFVMSALGLFQMDGGTSTKPIYEIGSPLFEKAVIHLDKKYYPGGTFTIEARNNSKENKYVQSAVLNGKPLEKPWFYHSELVSGGSLVLEMGPKPNKEWGIKW